MGPRIFLKYQTVRGCRGTVSFCKDSGSYCEFDKNGKTLYENDNDIQSSDVGYDF